MCHDHRPDPRPAARTLYYAPRPRSSAHCISRETVEVTVPGHEARNSILDRGRGRKADGAPEIVDVGARFRNVAGLHVEELLDGLSAKLAFEQIDHLCDLDRSIV